MAHYLRRSPADNDNDNDNNNPIEMTEGLRIESFPDTRDKAGYEIHYAEKAPLKPTKLYEDKSTVELRNSVPELGIEQSALEAGVKVEVTLLPHQVFRIRKYMTINGEMRGDEVEISKDQKPLYGVIKGLYEHYMEQKEPISEVKARIDETLEDKKTGTDD